MWVNVRLFYRCNSTYSESQSPGGNYWNHLTAVFGELLARVLMEVVTGSCSCHSATCWVALELLDKWHDRCTSSLSTCSSTKQLRWLLVGCTRQRKQQQVCSELHHICSYFPVLLSPVHSTVCPRLSNKPLSFEEHSNKHTLRKRLQLQGQNEALNAYIWDVSQDEFG